MAENQTRRKGYVGRFFFFLFFLLLGLVLMFLGPWLIGNAWDGDASFTFGLMSGYAEGVSDYAGPGVTQVLNSEQLKSIGGMFYVLGLTLFLGSTYVLMSIPYRKR